MPVSVRTRQRKAAAVVRSVVKPSRRPRVAAGLCREIEDLARLIKNAKREIAAIHPDEIRRKHLPTATDELDAIVAATADATGAILDAAEKLSGLALEGSVGAQVNEQVTRIYEACTFQDITGQRITKVVKTLQEIEGKVAEIVRVFGGAVSDKSSGRERKAKGEAALLNGPQLPDKAASQSDIDALFDKV
jgi:chemotaxis protein CheZ